jgi:hypothetical protein
MLIEVLLIEILVELAVGVIIHSYQMLLMLLLLDPSFLHLRLNSTGLQMEVWFVVFKRILRNAACRLLLLLDLLIFETITWCLPTYGS